MSDAPSEYYRDCTTDGQGQRILIGLTFSETKELESLFKLSARLDKNTKLLNQPAAKAAMNRLRLLLKKHIGARDRVWHGITI